MKRINNLFLTNILSVILIIVGATALFSQEQYFNIITEEEGIPNDDVYDILISQDGYLWLATDDGVSRYDGGTFRNYSTGDGLPAPSVVKLYEDLYGKIWFLSYNGMLSYYDDGVIHEYEYNDSIVKYFADNYFGKIYLDTTGDLVLAPRQGGKCTIDSKGNVFTRSELVPVRIDSCYLFFEDRGNDFFMSILSVRPEESKGMGQLYYRDNDYYLRVAYTNKQFQRHYLKTGEKEYVVSYRNIVFTIRNGLIKDQREFDDEVLSLYKDYDGNLWVSVKYDNGVYMFADADIHGKPVHFLNGYTISKVIQDREKNYWLSTEGNGIFYTPGFDFKLYSLPWDDRRLNVMSLAVSQDRLWFSSRDREIYSGRISKGNITNIRKFEIPKPYDWIKHIIVDKHGYLWLSSTQHLRYDPAGFPMPPDSVVNVNYIGKGKGDTIISANKRLGIYQNGKFLKLIKPDIWRRIYSTYQQDNDIWLGTLYGLYVLSEGDFYYKGNISKSLTGRINCINRINDLFVVGTATYGLVLMRGDSIVNSFNRDNMLLDNNIKSLFVQNDTTLWVGTKSGLSRIKINGGGNEYSIECYSQADGLPANEVNRITMHDNHIWLATSNGLVSFDPDKLEPHVSPPIIDITGIQIHGHEITISDQLILDHDQNDIRITFTGINFRKEGGVKYRYFMSDYNNEIVYTKNNWANFPNMLPGEYTFFVNVGNVHGIWNKEPRTISIEIKKHYTQTTFFIIMVVLISSLVVFSVTMFFQKQRKIRAQAKSDLIKMEQKIFRLQMNPHFVFNALLAIQGFMYQQNIHDAGRYLTSFAKLIRHTLYGSREEFIELDKEIEAMQYYMELQRLRFNENFDFNIVVENEVLPELIHIPPLLIQPFLENAIEHGLQHKDKPGKLSLRFYKKNHSLFIEIEDNGIGRENARLKQKSKGKLHKSLGMNIVQSRIQALNKASGKNISMEIVDLKDDLRQGIGTLVRIIIP